MSKKSGRRSQCHAPVIYARTVMGKHMPLDKQRDLSGTSRYAVMRDVNLILHVRTPRTRRGTDAAGIEHRHMPHYATRPARTATPEQDTIG